MPDAFAGYTAFDIKDQEVTTMPFQIIRNDITKVKADAIVNTANPEPLIGSGTDSAIYAAAGADAMLEERRKIGRIAPGQAQVTPAFALDAKYVIHTVGPSWVNGEHGERNILRFCYRNSLTKAAELECQSIAFPLIATGVYGFPKDEALQIALDEINGFLLTHDMTVILVVFDRKAFELSGKLVGDIEEYIDEHSAQAIREKEYSGASRRRQQRRESMVYESPAPSWLPGEARRPLGAPKGAPGPIGAPKEITFHRDAAPDLEEAFASQAKPVWEETFADEAASGPIASVVEGAEDFVAGGSLEDLLENTEDTFQQRLFKLIDESGMDDVTVYKKANIDRKVFSRIRCKEDYKPKKKTALAFAIALQLNMPEVQDLLSRAGIALSPSNKFDLIISYFITNRIYDIYEINAALFKYGQPILGE